MTTNALDNIIDIDATISTGIASGPDFGRVLVVTTDVNVGSNDRILEFDDFNAVVKRFSSGGLVEAARSYFRQEPTPPPLKVGKWFKAAVVSTATGSFTPTLAAVVAATGGVLTVNGVSTAAITLTGSASLTAAAATIQTALATVVTGATVTFTGNRFVVTLGTGSEFASAPSGSLAAVLGLNNGAIRNEGAVETVDEGMAAIAAAGVFYWTTASSDITDAADILDIANWAIANDQKYFVYEDNTAGTIVTSNTASIGSQLSALGSNYAKVIYGGTNDGKDYEIAAQFSAVDFNGNDTLIAIHNRTLIGSVGDNLTSAQISELERKHISYYQQLGTVGYVAGGRSTSGVFMDIIYGLDWMVNAMRVEVFNALSRSRRVPQTPAGLNIIRAAIRTVCEQAFRVGIIDGVPFSPTVTAVIRRATGNASFSGSTVKGYYIHISSIAAQSQTNRENRITPPITVWLKSGGSVAGAKISLRLEQ